MALDRGPGGALRRPAAVAAAAFALVATGCWPQPGGGPEHTRANTLETGLNSGNVSGLAEAWSVPTAALAYEPVVANGRVVVSEDDWPGDGSVHVEAFSPGTGARLWHRVLVDSSVRPIVNPVAFSGDALVTGYGWAGGVNPPPSSCPTGIERLDPATGARLSFEPGRRPMGPAVTSGDHVAVVTQPIGAGCVPGTTLRLEVRDRDTLAMQYSYTPPDGSLSFLPTFAGDKVIIPDGSSLLAFPAAGCGATTCSPAWTATVPSSPPISVTSFGGAAVASNGVLFVKTTTTLAGRPPTISSAVRAFDPATGAQLSGVADIGSNTGVLAVRGSTIYYTQEPGAATEVIHVRAIEYCADCATPFTTSWSVPIPARFFTTEVTVGGDVVYVGVNDVSSDGVVVALGADGCGAETCSPLATVPVTGSALELSVSGGRVFAATTLGNFNFALSALALP